MAQSIGVRSGASGQQGNRENDVIFGNEEDFTIVSGLMLKVSMNRCRNSTQHVQKRLAR
jgi:hypothetical protein